MILAFLPLFLTERHENIPEYLKTVILCFLSCTIWPTLTHVLGIPVLANITKGHKCMIMKVKF